MLMNKTKSLYEAPTVDLINLRIEEGILTTSPLSSSGFGEQGNVRDQSDDDDWGW